ncbi:hypothetical protein JCM10908_005843 [Rhodotorula pacifica]|uniref:uncharacterized protein n=1 Tax=Rhodotorula pacifica TaxID=1495444 RepID=UPI0031726003
MPSVDQPASLAPPSSFASLKPAAASTHAGPTPSSAQASSVPDYPTFEADPSSTDEYYARAHRVSDLLALDVHVRDAANEIPYRQVQLLRDSGLVTALGDRKYGGGGQSPEVGYKIVRIVARGDGSIGQVLAYHYFWSWTALVVGTAEQIDFEARRYVENKWVYGGAVNPRDSDLAITESEDGKKLIFNGRKAFSTGSKISDLTVLEGVLPDGKTHVFAIVESKQPGIVYGDDWKDVLGMRGTQSGSITISNVEVPWERALGFVNKEFVPIGGFNTLLLPAIQLHFISFYLGIAEGALAKAADYTTKNTRAWPFAADPKEKGSDEFYIQETYGVLQADLWALEAQVDRLAASISELLTRQDRASVTDEERGEIAVRIAGAKVTSTRIALEVTSKIYEVLGARSIGFRAGFDHFWRNVRTHTLHDPVAHKKAEVGRYALRKELPTGTGYGVVVGLGALFAIGMIGISELLKRSGKRDDNEEFTVAGRTLKTGLTAAGVVSSWTWSVTLLSSTVVAYRYGIAGAFFYGSCCSPQVQAYANLAIQAKRKAPAAHTFLEVMKVRYGTFVHLSYMLFALASNLLVVSSILVGGAAAINSLTGVPVYASLWLLPISVAAYTLRGGLRATLLTDWMHTVIIFVVVLVFYFKVFATSNLIGSPSKMYDLLIAAQARNGDAATYQHSYLTVRSLGALKFAVLSILEYSGVVALDNSFFAKGAAASPEDAVPGYILGGLAWIASPFTLATTMGLAALALENTPSFPTYPRRMTEAELGAGLVLPYAAQTILGTGGAAAVLILMFMSCTSALSSQLMGVSTVLSFDVYKTYLRPHATDRDLLWASHLSVVGFSLCMAGFASALHGGGVDLGFLYNFCGIFTGPGLVPMLATFFSDRPSALSAAVSLWLGFPAGVAAWLGIAHRQYGVVNLTSTGSVDACLYGCLTGMAVSGLITLLFSLFRPAHYDWHGLSAVKVVDADGNEIDAFVDKSYNPEKLRRSALVARWAALFLFLALFVLWPLPLYGTKYIFSKKFFTGWIAVGGAWAFFTIFAVGLLPIFESRRDLWALITGIGKGPAQTPAAAPGSPVKEPSLDEKTSDKTSLSDVALPVA